MKLSEEQFTQILNSTNIAPKGAEACRLHFVEGLTITEASKKVGLSPSDAGEIRIRFQKAIEQYRSEQAQSLEMTLIRFAIPRALEAEVRSLVEIRLSEFFHAHDLIPFGD